MAAPAATSHKAKPQQNPKFQEPRTNGDLALLEFGSWFFGVFARPTLSAVRGNIFRSRAVIRSFLGNDDVMGMALLHRGPADQDEASPRAQLLNVPRAAITHAGT